MVQNFGMPRKDYCKATLTEIDIGRHNICKYSRLSGAKPMNLVNLQSRRKLHWLLETMV